MKEIIAMIVMVVTLGAAVVFQVPPERRDLDGAWVVEKSVGDAHVYLYWRSASRAMNALQYLDWTPNIFDAQRFSDRMTASSAAVQYDGTAIPITEAIR